ncbi:hypothetical protein AAG570_007413 [Ranatra chinensis]|uniref:Uncharacterized protein n=1 Tax=Ranatra chinensis TaxID=642074 RepID=A0ABD0Y8T5_9HEMI
MKRKDTPLNEEVSNDLELDVSAGLYSRSNDKKSITYVDAVKYGGAKKGGNIGLKEEVSNVLDSAALAESRDGGSTADAAISSLNTERHGGSKKGKDIPSNDEVSKLISHKSNEFELDAPAGSYRRSTSVGNSISSVNAEASARIRSATQAGRKSVGGTSLYRQPGLRSKTQVEIRKNVKKYTFDERKLEELKNNNKSLAQRLKSIKERKSPLSWRSWYKSPETDKGEKIVTSKEKAAKCDNP